MIPRLSPIRGKILVETNTNDHVKTFYYQQTLDHFNFFPQSYKTFPQRYFINFKYWGGANSTAPIFVTFGGEAKLDPNDFVGFNEDNAARLAANEGEGTNEGVKTSVKQLREAGSKIG
jgi:lysosomal Pro-X carboxypeptidase